MDDDDWGNDTLNTNVSTEKPNFSHITDAKPKVTKMDVDDCDWGWGESNASKVTPKASDNIDTDWGNDWGDDTTANKGNDDSNRSRSFGKTLTCFGCGETGHRKNECPKNTNSRPRGCFNCGGSGHMSRDCTEPKKERTGGGGGPRACFNCNETGHMSRECPQPKKMRNDNRSNGRTQPNNNDTDWGFDDASSKKKEKIIDDDRWSWDGNENADANADDGQSRPRGRGGGSRACHKCGEEGHMSRECPNRGENDSSGMECRRCKKTGHKAAECEEEVLGEDGKPKPPPYRPAELNLNDDSLYSAIPTGINFNRYDKIKVNVTGNDVPRPIVKFEDAIKSDIINEAIVKSKYTAPTPIQKYAIPIIMAGRDMMGCAQTGSGKTGAFILPILQTMFNMASNLPSLNGAECQEPTCVVISPTRELAIQIHTEAVKFSNGSIISPKLIYGGVTSGYHKALMQKGAHFLVATPGRLLDFLDKGFLSFAKLKYLVLDEADRMIDQGFLPEIRRMVVHESMPDKKSRQTLMFSATFPSDVQHMAAEFLSPDYLFLTVGVVGAANSDVEQKFIQVDGKQKRAKLMEVLNAHDENDRTLIFVEKKKTADFLASFLSQSKLKSTSIHGDRFQKQREEALLDFRTGKMPVLVATAVAARGLDIKDVKHVINYDLPKEVDEYVHRIGRTGRVGNLGKATSFFDPNNSQDMAIVSALVKVLSESDQTVPEWLSDIASGGASFGGDFDGGDFGSTDIRKDLPTTNEEDWD